MKLADKKKEVTDDDILVLAGAERSAAHNVKLDYLQVTTGKGVRSVASIGLQVANEHFEAAASGNGPVDAAINALKCIIKRKMTLKEFTIQALSKGFQRVLTTWVRYTCRWSTTVTSTMVLVLTPTS